MRAPSVAARARDGRSGHGVRHQPQAREAAARWMCEHGLKWLAASADRATTVVAKVSGARSPIAYCVAHEALSQLLTCF